MGKEIVYCGICGKSLLEDEFTKGKAHYQDNTPYCTACRAPQPKEQLPHTPSGRGMAPTKPGSTSRMVRPGTPKHGSSAQSQDSKRLIYIGGGVAGGALFLLLLILAFSGRGNSPPPRPPPEPPKSANSSTSTRVDPTPKRIDPPPVAGGVPESLQALERLASNTLDADRILARCAAVREELRGTPHASKVDAIEAKALKMKQQQEIEAVTAEISMARKEDPDYRKVTEILQLYDRAIKAAGPDRARFEQEKAAYDKAAKEGAAAALKNRLGPFELDKDGYVNNWLLTGPFPNPNDSGRFKDYLGTEEEHIPSKGKRAGDKPWTPVQVSAGVVNLLTEPALGPGKREWIIVYAGCWLEAERDVDVELRIGTDDGFKLWVDGESQIRNHVSRAMKPDSDKHAFKLTRGTHRILMKVDQGKGDGGLMMRVTAPDGRKASGVRVWN